MIKHGMSDSTKDTTITAIIEEESGPKNKLLYKEIMTKQVISTIIDCVIDSYKVQTKNINPMHAIHKFQCTE